MDDRSPQSSSATVGISARLGRGAIAVGFLAALAGSSQSHCGVACKPIITVKTVQMSAVQEMQRVWTAVLVVDSARCATSFGRFEIDFMREKEYAPDMQFTEQFDWKPGEIKVSLDLWWDEVVADYRIGFIAPCVCRELQF
jgi:hypothetical protein